MNRQLCTFPCGFLTCLHVRRVFSGREGDLDTKAPMVAKERSSEEGDCVKNKGGGEERPCG